jgi:hypothetical protein
MDLIRELAKASARSVPNHDGLHKRSRWSCVRRGISHLAANRVKLTIHVAQELLVTSGIIVLRVCDGGDKSGETLIHTKI